MQQLGFVNTSTNKQSPKEIKQMCKNAIEIKIINVSGFHYLNDNEIEIKNAIDKGVKVKFLCCCPTSIFLKNIENIEYWQGIRDKNSEIANEIFDLINKYKQSGIEIRFYTTEYRLPYVLSYYKDGSVKAWLTMTLPPYKSTKAFVLRGEKKKNCIYDDEINFVDMMETNFDVIWEHASKALEEIIEKNDD